MFASQPHITFSFRSTFLLSLLVVATVTVRGERLPIRYYRSDDGLAHNRVKQIVRDSQGFLWFCTSDGLARFDGQRFTTFRLEEGLISSFNDFLETVNGEYWAATNGTGVCRFNYSPRSPAYTVRPGELFTIYPVGDTMLTNSVNVLREDRDGRIWAGTDSGLFVLDIANGSESFVPVGLNIASHADRVVQVWAITEDEEGSLWIGTKYGLVCHLTDGRMIHYKIRPYADGVDVVYDIFEDDQSRLWIGHEAGLVILKPTPASTDDESRPLWQTLARKRKGSDPDGNELPSAPSQALWLTTADGLGSDSVRRIFQASDGRIYVASLGGYLTVFDGQRFRTYSNAEGLGKQIGSIAEDVDGNLWLGTLNDGATRLARAGLVSFGKADGLKSTSIYSIFDDREGNLYFWGNEWRLHRFEGNRFISVRVNLPPRISDADMRGTHRLIKDREGQWWVSTRAGLFRFPRVSRFEELARARPVSVYTTRHGLVDNDVRQLFEDSRGDIWITTFSAHREVVTRWERATGRFHRYSDADGLPRLKRVMSFGEDGSGSVWIGFWGGGLARYKAGRFTLFTSEDGIPDHHAISMSLDYAGRLWISLCVSGGLYRIDHWEEERPHFVKYSGELRGYCGPMTEDNHGRIYFGTLRGLARFDPAVGQVRYYTSADGLGATEITAAHCDRQGNLWFGTSDGLSRLTPVLERRSAPPPVFISSLTVGGTHQPISVFGENEISGIEVGMSHSQIQIEYFGLSFASGGPLRYQYMIDGLDSDWSEPTDQRTFYANLRPGAYRFLVRAVSPDGEISAQPASFSFRVLPPFWQRWWFLSLVFIAAAMLIYLIHRRRVSRLVELERVRTRIATDLHDDIGASLSQMAVTTEVLRRQIPSSDPRIAENLSLIGRVSREVVDSMSDIVWAINPQKDNLQDLARRMRRFAGETLGARDIEMHFNAPESEHYVKLGADARRQVFLIFKETINNIVRHADCTQTRIALTVDGSWLVLRVGDNGNGISRDQTREGQGLASMKVRAERLGGTLKIDSPAGRGTTLTLKIPHRRPLWLGVFGHRSDRKPT